MEFKGTQGKWHYEENSGYNHYVIDENDYSIVCLYMNADKDKANAILISKAPEMLEMLKELISHYEDIIKQDFSPFALRSDIDKARELIKEATNV